MTAEGSKKTQIIPLLLLVLAAAIWGTAFVAQSVGAEYVGPLTFLMARSWIGAAFLIPVIMVRDRFLLSHTGENEKPRNKTQLKTLLAGGAVTGTALFLAALSQQAGRSCQSSLYFSGRRWGKRSGAASCSPSSDCTFFA